MEKSFPFNAVTVDGAPDRVYTAEDFAAERAAYVSNGVTRADALAVTPAAGGGMQVEIAPGAACVDGYTYWNTAALSLPLAAADASLARIDLVVLCLDHAARRMYCAVKAGTPAVTPVMPATENTADTVELPLASVEVSAGETVIESAHITDLRPRADYILNPMEVEAAVAEYAAALEAYFGEENAEALISASRILRTDAGADTVLYGDGVYRALPESGTAMVELARFTASGTFDPALYPTVDNSYVVVLLGAGGSGAFGAPSSLARGGDAGGYAVVRVLPHVPGPYAVTIGVGGAGVTGASVSEYKNGNPGGTTRFGPFYVKGGEGGTVNSSVTPVGITYGAYSAGVGKIGTGYGGGESFFGAGGKNSTSAAQSAGVGGIGAGGGAHSVFNCYSGAGGNGIVIVYGCPA